jgi:predicted phosphohydrolase
MFQYISDIHLEYLTYVPDIKKSAENLCLLGDIGHPGSYLFNKFIDKYSKQYTNIFFIYGNHEYYSVLKGRYKKKETFKERNNYSYKFPKNVYFLDNSAIYINTKTNAVSYKKSEGDDVIKLIGSTLWSNKDPGSRNYKNIYIDPETLFTFENECNLHKIAKDYILQELDREDIKCILLTHYPTHILCNQLFIDNTNVNHIPEIFYRKNIIACINGHLHHSIDLIATGSSIRLLSNCYGYKTEDKLLIGYNETKTLDYTNKHLSFYGIYSTVHINTIEILYKVMTRQNPIYNLGPLDENVSYTITNIQKDNSIIYASNGFKKLTGYSKNEIIGKNCRFLQDPNIQRGSIREYCNNESLYQIKKKIIHLLLI